MRALGATLLLTALALAAVPARAETTTLVCVQGDANGTIANPHPNWHQLLAIDYGARTVREYAVDDDGGVTSIGSTDTTYSAQVSDNEIAFGDGASSNTLGRYSGIWTLTSGRYVFRYRCKPYTPPSGARRF